MIGVDLVYIPEFQNQLQVGGRVFIEKAFRTSEIKNLQSEELAGIWAAKEAVVKAAPKPPEKWTDIVISFNAQGKPSAKFGSQSFEISIANHGEYAVAVAYRAGL